MFAFAVAIGLFSYSIFFLGLFGMLYPQIVLVWSSIFWVAALLFFWKRKKYIFPRIMIAQLDPFLVILLSLLVVQSIVNLIGAFGPELGFDALWYHLTLPKLYLLHHRIYYIPGGLLYYSAMPKLVEMLYIPAIVIGGESSAKVVHFLFGLLCCASIYGLAKMRFSTKVSLLAVVVFYANLVVGWESITAYIDLGRTFYESMALWGFLLWVKTEEKKWLFLSAVMLGLAITAKLLAGGSLITCTILIGYVFLKKKKNVWWMMSNILAYWTVTVLLVLPWLVFAWLNTGNPVYPFFSGYPMEFSNLWAPVNLFRDIMQLLLFADDPISPVYLMILPLCVIFYKQFQPSMKLVLLYCGLSLLIWYSTPRTGGGRFILPYLPAFSLLVGEIIVLIKKNVWVYRSFIAAVIVTACMSIGYRGLANKRYISMLFGQQSKDEFLSQNLHFSFGDFYDIDRGISSRVYMSDKVLLYGFHNLYYVNFPFIHESWVVKGDRFNYIATQGTDLPRRFIDWHLVYKNNRTGVTLYSKGSYERY